MNQHILQLQVTDTYNPGIFLIKDTSIYSSLLPISCPELQILPPGFGVPTVVSVQSGFDLVLNACGLGILQAPACATSCPMLIDGIYNIRYSVSPNSQVWVEYNYLRITKAVNTLNELLCKLPLQCSLPSQELEYDINNITMIREYLNAAQIYVGQMNRCADGINMYRFALTLIEKMSTCRPNC
jgi:hypothetical protein